MDLAKIVDKKSYASFAGDNWPTYNAFVLGIRSNNNAINAELDKFISIMKERYDNLRLGDYEQLALENQQRQGQAFYNKNALPKARCNVPWDTLGINSNGNIFICQSPTWVPKFVGNILEVDDIFTALNSEMAQAIRREIMAGRYYYCNEKLCSFFANLDKKYYQIDEQDTEPTTQEFHELFLTVHSIPTNLIFDFDYTCNFKCPSCRNEVINWNNDHLIRPINDHIVDKIKHLIIDKITDQLVNIRWAGGEPFISEAYLELFEYIIASGKQNIQNIVQTNGSSLQSKIVPRLLPYISELRISFDAATAETYAKTRVNGNWAKLLENVQHVKQQIVETGAKTRLTADFVVQYDNYKEIPQFVALCDTLGISRFNLQKMWNWGTWDDATFAQNNVYTPTHPQYTDLEHYFALAGQQILNG